MNCDFCKEPLTNGRHPLTESGAHSVIDCQVVFLLRRNGELEEALRELHDDIQGRIDDGARFNPGTLYALRAAKAALPTGDSER